MTEKNYLKVHSASSWTVSNNVVDVSWLFCTQKVWDLSWQKFRFTYPKDSCIFTHPAHWTSFCSVGVSVTHVNDVIFYIYCIMPEKRSSTQFKLQIIINPCTCNSPDLYCLLFCSLGYIPIPFVFGAFVNQILNPRLTNRSLRCNQISSTWRAYQLFHFSFKVITILVYSYWLRIICNVICFCDNCSQKSCFNWCFECDFCIICHWKLNASEIFFYIFSLSKTFKPFKARPRVAVVEP